MKGIVKIEIPKSCYGCQLFIKVRSVGWTEYMACGALDEEVDVSHSHPKHLSEYYTFDYCTERYLGCPIKEIK